MLQYVVSQSDNDNFIITIMEGEFKGTAVKIVNLKMAEDGTMDFEIELPKNKTELFENETFKEEISEMVGDIVKKYGDARRTELTQIEEPKTKEEKEIVEVPPEKYGERTAGLILALHLDDAFHSWWFIGLSAFLCLNLLCCNLIRLPGLLKRVHAFAKPDGTTASNATAEAEGTGDPRRLFAALHGHDRVTAGEAEFELRDSRLKVVTAVRKAASADHQVAQAREIGLAGMFVAVARLPYRH